MSLGACIDELREEGKLNRDQADYLAGLYDRLRRRQNKTFGQMAGDAAASEEALTHAQFDARLRRRQALLDVAAKKRALSDMETYRGKKGDFGRAAEALFVHDDRAPYENLEYREIRRREQVMALMSDVLEKHRRNLIGQVRDGAGVKDLLREMMGEHTGNVSATEAAKAVDAADDLQIAQFNAAGGAIRKLENRGVRQVHIPEKVGAVSLDDWKAAIDRHFDLGRLTDYKTGVAFTPEKLDAWLDDLYHKIRTDGAAESEEGAFGGMKIANRHQEERYLVAKSADDWMAYAERFGNPNVFDAIMSEKRSLAREIAAMEMLGPNPAASVRWLRDVVANRARIEYGAGTPKATKIESSAHRIQAYWDTYMGAGRQGERNWLSWAGSTLRAHQVSSKLGGAAVTALPTDMFTQGLTRYFDGLPVLNVASDYMRFLVSSGQREELARFGFAMEESAGAFSTQARLWGQELSGEWQSRVAEGVMRLSGLNLVTDAGREAFGWRILNHITSERKTAWSALNPRFRGMFDRYGIDEAAWDKLRATPLAETANGSKWIHPDNSGDRSLADRVMEMIYSERDFSVVTPGLKARALVAGFGRRGTLVGEVARSLFQFKSFPTTLLYQHWARMLAMQGRFNKAAYMASFVGTLTAAGWIALEAKALFKGEDPLPLNVKTLLAAAQQGGGIGIYGDFLFSTQNRTGQGFSSTLLGPSASTVDAVTGLAFGTPMLQAEGEPVDYDRQLVRLLRSETPGGSLWYTRLAFDRLILDQYQAAADPHYYQAWHMAEQYAHKQGTGFWWAPGATTPDRAPELGNGGLAQ